MKSGRLLDRRSSNRPATHQGRIHRARDIEGASYSGVEVVCDPSALMVVVSSE
jgi:hypothetical protein